MNIINFSGVILGIVMLASCGGNSSDKEHEGHDMAVMNKDSTQPVNTSDEKEIKQVAVTYSSVDPKVATSLKEVVDHYLEVKNALANDDASGAASGASAMATALKGVDKSLFTAEQKKSFDGVSANLKEHAEHIGENADNIKHQRLHFADMSMDVYDLVKAFGAGRPLYHDHCPMARDNKGAMWMSESKAISNPYFGASMLTCGTVEEVVQ